MNNKTESTKVLVVEDEPDILYSMEFTLSREGFTAVTAENGLDGLKKFHEAMEKNEPFDLVVTDIQMPDLTGTQLIDKIQQQAPETPTLVITGYGDKDTVVELMRLGCLDYLDKPFTPPTFLSRIRHVLEKSRARQEVAEKKIQQLRKEAGDYESQLAFYRETLEKFEWQFKSAKGSYENLIQVKKEYCPIPIAWKIRQYAELGGDYFDIKASANGCDILVADVSGHDMGASYHTVMLKAFFEENSRTGNDGVTFFNLLNRQLLECHDCERMVTAMFIRLQIEAMKGEVVSAGHPTLIRMREGSPAPFAFKLSGDVLGVHETVHFEKRRFNLKPHDRYIVYTDGILNAAGIEGETGKKNKLAQEGLERLIQENKQLPLEQMTAAVWDKILDFCRYKPVDDMLLFGFEIAEKGGKKEEEKGENNVRS